MLAEDGRRLLQYVARHGDLTINNDIAKGTLTRYLVVSRHNMSVSTCPQYICYLAALVLLTLL